VAVISPQLSGIFEKRDQEVFKSFILKNPSPYIGFPSLILHSLIPSIIIDNKAGWAVMGVLEFA